MLEGLNESISGSDSSSDESVDGSADPLATLLKKNAVLSSPENEPQGQLSKKGAGKAPLIWFTSPLLPPSTSLGVYRALFSNAEQADASYLTALHSKQLGTHTKGKEPHIFLCMIGGGHFAAMVVSLAPKVSKRHTTGVDERQAAVIVHKTFHRYTTRRKQGGAQSSNDASKGAAHSAGSSLRRYNEQALIAEIRELLAGWREYLGTAELLFIRAAGTANQRTLFGYEGAPIKSNDPRIRGFPFSTRRATQSELTRCFVELTRMKTSRIDEASLAALDAKTSETPVAKPPKPAPPKLSKEEEAQILHSTQLTALIRRSKAPAVLSYLTSNHLSPDYTFTPPTHHTPTLLHLAASSNSPAVVLALLTKAGANPTLITPEQPKPPFDLCGDRATRDAFRLARTELGEVRWDWAVAHIPLGLTKKQVDERERRERDEGNKEEKERREKEVKRLKEEEAERRAVSTKQGGRGGRNLGANVQMSLGRKEEEERGLTPEARMRLERERRARAAEERIKRFQGGQ